MILTISNEVPFQILSSSFSIGPSETGYELQVGADSSNFTTLFSVGANTPRMVTNVANGSYFRLKNNVGDVKVNWQRVCTDEGGGGASGTELSPVSEFPAGAEAGTVIAYSGSSSAAGIYQFDGTDWVEAGGSVDLSAYYTSAQTKDAISAATSGKADAVNVQTYGDYRYFPKWNEQGIITDKIGSTVFETSFGINNEMPSITVLRAGWNRPLPHIYAPTTSGNAGEVLVSLGDGGAPVWSAVTMGGNSPIIPAITTQAEYEAISGDVKTGDLIQVYNVKINGDDNPPVTGLFEAKVQEEEYEGVVRKSIYWERRDNSYSVLLSDEVYPWMAQNGVQPIEFLGDTFIISSDMTAGGEEAYNGIGFDIDGKPVITHIAPAYDDGTGEITGITREDTPIVGGADMSAYTPTSGFSTINGSAITNGGDIVIQGGADMSAYYTSAQTDAAIAQAVSGLATEQYVQDAISGANMNNYWTSAQTEDAISAATSGKADAANVTPNDFMRFPKWNAQGIITGTTGNNLATTGFYLNGTRRNLIKEQTSGDLGDLYAPTTPGTAGQILVSAGNGAPIWANDDKVSSTSVSTIWKGTQAEYDAITTKDPNTFYIIVSN